jgi:hypothetical protein
MKRISKRDKETPPDVREKPPGFPGKGGGSPPGLLGRRPYESPRLIRYGTLEDLTEGYTALNSIYDADSNQPPAD